MAGIKPPTAPNNSEVSNVNRFELEGFTIEYSVHGSTDIFSEDVRGLFYDTMDDAVATIEEGKFKKVIGDKEVLARITRGAPQVCRNEALKMEYVGSKWRRI